MCTLKYSSLYLKNYELQKKYSKTYDHIILNLETYFKKWDTYR